MFLAFLSVWMGMFLVPSFGTVPVDPIGIRTNYCERSKAVANGSLELRDALKGMTVTVVVSLLTNPFFMDISNETGQPVGGFMLNIQNKLAERGGFEFKYVLVKEKPASQTFTNRLLELLPIVDMYANTWYADTSSRRVLGIGESTFLTFFLIL
jgi:hypothetical protein